MAVYIDKLCVQITDTMWIHIIKGNRSHIVCEVPLRIKDETGEV